MGLATRIAGLLGLLGVALGAFGAHALESTLVARHMTGIWHTAVLYHLIHAVASLWGSQRSSPLVVWLWTAGVTLFSGSLYLYALLGTHWLVFVTPVGGAFFLVGWLVVIIKPKG
ncbi:DUF423 domain-containing protein [soil metagenome]